MSKRITAALGTAVLAVALSAFTDSALAGNGNGNADPHATPAVQQSASHGNAATAPGQVKKDQTSTVTPTNASTTAAKGSARQNTSTSIGVKPTNATLKNQWAAASSTKTKRYGNGSTAGQIATKAGFGSAMLYGPGNSQPHKASCGRHLIDVHALKAHAGAVCSSSTTISTTKQSPTPSTSTSSTTKTSATTSASSNHGATVAQVAKNGAGATAAAASPAATAAGGVLGATASSGKGSGFGGVLGALTSVGHGTLPFTGFPVWAAGFAGALLLLGGTGLARHARTTV
jgi:hypothetical protein